MLSRRTRVSGGSFDVIQLFRSLWNDTMLYLIKYAISVVFGIFRLFSEKEAETCPIDNRAGGIASGSASSAGWNYFSNSPSQEQRCLAERHLQGLSFPQSVWD